MTLIKGESLTHRQRMQVLSAFVHRNTIEHPFQLAGGTPVTDTEWINTHAFYFVADGSRLSNKHRHCEPHYLAA